MSSRKRGQSKKRVVSPRPPTKGSRGGSKGKTKKTPRSPRAPAASSAAPSSPRKKNAVVPSNGVHDTLPVPEEKSHRRRPSLPAISGDHVTVSSKTNSTAFETLDEQVNHSQTFQDLWRIVRMTSAQESYPAMTTVLETEGRDLVGAASLRFFLVHKNVFHRANQTYPVDSSGIITFVFSAREIIMLEDPSKDKRYNSKVDKDSTLRTVGPTMWLPVVADSDSSCSGTKDTIGVFIACKEKGSTPFSSRDCTVLYRLGEFAGNVLRNAERLQNAHERFYVESQSRKRANALLDVSKALGSENRLSKLVSVIVSQVPELLDCDRCTLFLVDNDKQELIVTRGASHGREPSLVSWIFGQSGAPELPFPKGCDEIRFSMSKGIAGHVGLTGETINIVDAHKDKRFNPEFDQATGYRTRSVLCMAMRDGTNQVIGVVQAINKNPSQRSFSKEDELLLQTFSAQAAIAVRNSKLYEDTSRALERSEALLEVTSALSQELKLPALVKTIVAIVQKLLRAQRCTVFLVDERRKELYTNDTMSAGMGAALPVDRERDDMTRFPMDRGIAGNVATSGTIVNIPDAYQDQRFNRTMDKKTGFRTTSILCMPIKNRKNEIIGVTQVINKMASREHGDNIIIPFGAEDEELLSVFNMQAAVAVENSRLYTNTEKALNHAMAEKRNLRFLLNVTKNLSADLHLQSMIEQLTMQVHHLLKADNCALYLVDPDTKQFYLARPDMSASSGTAPVVRYPLSVGIVGLVADTGKSVRISSAAFKDPRFHPAVDQRKGHVTQSILCCPITAESQDRTAVIGVISVRDEKDRGGFEVEEEKLLKVFCAQAAVAIINSKRFATMLDSSEFKATDHTAADYLMSHHNMKIDEDSIERFQYSMDEIKLQERIGTGSYGEVYRAHLRDRLVAVKKLFVRNMETEQLEAFCSEASVMCQLKHDNIVLFIGAVTEPSNLCIVTEYCGRGSLADLLLDPLVDMDDQRKLTVCMQAALGMLYLHSSNPVILHRDLKSDNLLVTSDWTVKVADFGLTRYMSEKKMTQVGTPMWMAPEIIMGKKYTEKADVYAFGIILWEIMTRLEPYDDKEPMQIVVEVVNDDLRPTIPSEFTDHPLVPLMKLCWDGNAEKRPTFKVIVERLKAIIDSYAAKK